MSGVLPSCPHCRATKVIRYGRPNGVQRYLCHGCSRTFNARTGTLLAGVRRCQERLQFEQLVHQYRPLRVDAQELNVSVATVFRWRHAIIAGLAQRQRQELQQRSLQGEFAVWIHRFWDEHNRWHKAESFFRVMSAQSRGELPKLVVAFVVSKSPKSVSDPWNFRRPEEDAFQAIVLTKLPLERNLAVHFDPQTRLYLRDWVADLQRQDRQGDKYVFRRQRRRKPTMSQLHGAYALRRRFVGWMIRFHGVALHYLERYAAWFNLVVDATL